MNFKKVLIDLCLHSTAHNAENTKVSRKNITENCMKLLYVYNTSSLEDDSYELSFVIISPRGISYFQLEFYVLQGLIFKMDMVWSI